MGSDLCCQGAEAPTIDWNLDVSTMRMIVPPEARRIKSRGVHFGAGTNKATACLVFFNVALR
ncbi:MAG: hypothetical protein ACYS14_07780 [Planctomycetota bacterium]